MDWLNVGLPAAELVLGIGEHLASSIGVFEGSMYVSGHNRGIVEKVQDTTRLFCQDDLLLGSLDRGCEMDVVGLFELLASLYAGLAICLMP